MKCTGYKCLYVASYLPRPSTAEIQLPLNISCPQPHAATSSVVTSIPLQALMDSSNKGEEGVPLQKLLPTLNTSRSQASLLKESRSQATLKTSQA